MSIEHELLRSVFTFTSENAMHLALVDANRSMERLLTIAAFTGPSDAKTAATVMTWVLRRKGVVLDTVCRFRSAQQAQSTDATLRDQTRRWNSCASAWPTSPCKRTAKIRPAPNVR